MNKTPDSTRGNPPNREDSDEVRDDNKSIDIFGESVDIGVRERKNNKGKYNIGLSFTGNDVLKAKIDNPSDDTGILEVEVIHVDRNSLSKNKEGGPSSKRFKIELFKDLLVLILKPDDLEYEEEDVDLDHNEIDIDEIICPKEYQSILEKFFDAEELESNTDNTDIKEKITANLNYLKEDWQQID